jgi:hypothetical protein
MKQSITVFALTAALASASAFAVESKMEPAKAPQKAVKMSDAQLDNVSAGALLNVLVIDAVDINNNQVQVAVPVNANVAATVLGGTAGAAGTQLGNITQRR